ncbi:hypothetical protein AD01_1598 [Escherichia coli 2-427-07_S4_C2]|jgi:hypothetical protein|nr:hypothetical protein AD01_1598 [Escherichia coli 2-427-07_S4_C2]KEJ39399.1 hypothetical protein AB65_3298 [Escherichia coli 2-460-02_S1_C3]KEO38582.1 hypothetical protein AB34_3100 [Escherichia coli 2-460-02_S1_C2]
MLLETVFQHNAFFSDEGGRKSKLVWWIIEIAVSVGFPRNEQEGY